MLFADGPATNPEVQLRNINAATKALDESTARIEKQIEALQASQRFLHNHIAQSRAAQQYTDSKARGVSDVRRKQLLHRQHLQALNDELRSIFTADLSTSRSTLQRTINSLPTLAAQRLKHDDLILDEIDHQLNKLQQVRQQHDDPSTTSASSLSRNEKLLQILAQTLSSTIRTKLDRTYLTHCRRPEPQPPTATSRAVDSEDSVPAIHNDLTTLTAEIDDLATMLVEHDHGSGISATQRAVVDARERVWSAESVRVLQRIEGLIEGLVRVGERCEIVAGQRLVVERIAHVAEGEVEDGEAVGHGGREVRKEEGGPVREEQALVALLKHLRVGMQVREVGGSHKGNEVVRAVTTALSKAQQQQAMLAASAVMETNSNAEKLRHLENDIARAKDALEGVA